VGKTCGKNKALCQSGVDDLITRFTNFKAKELEKAEKRSSTMKEIVKEYKVARKVLTAKVNMIKEKT